MRGRSGLTSSATHVRWYWHVVVIGFLSFLIGLGVRSIIADDARYGWAPFKDQTDFTLRYDWVLRDGRVVRYRPGSELRGKARRIDGSRRRRTYYAIGAIRALIRGYAQYLLAHRAPEQTVAFRAVVTYQINRNGKTVREVLEYPQRRGNG